MKILLIGNGAREHVIFETLARSKYKPRLYAVVGARNPGILELSEDFTVGKVTDADLILSFSKKKNIDLVVIGPEAPLEAGVTDALEDIGIPCVGPSKSAARLETDKSFVKNLMEKYKTSGRIVSKVFDDADELCSFIDSFGKPVVIKPLGLTGGKGVKIVDPKLDGQLKSNEEAKKYGKEIIEKGISGFNKALVEERLEGEEFTLQAFTDGSVVKPMPLVQDHKFAYEGDNGPFTGGMGSYSDSNHLLPFMTAEDRDAAIKVIEEVVAAMRKEGITYKGIIYGGFMLTKEGPKILEFNARFGDPEAMNVLPLLETDFVDVCQAIVNKKLSDIDIIFSNMATVCKYAVPKGYPENPVTNQKIAIKNLPKDARLYYASVDKRQDGLYMTRSRAIACVGVGKTLEEAEKIAQAALTSIDGPIHYRSDIGTRALIQKRVEHMKELRNEAKN
ncbi:MAG: phosphoribosylamine--glycine ligase [Candidatus Aenigmarchaeota archaeon]|nr:phosphoribosylamine--glycine ligase [Candidatus Aenigmarchaeota archaeon]